VTGQLLTKSSLELLAQVSGVVVELYTVAPMTSGRSKLFVSNTNSVALLEKVHAECAKFTHRFSLASGWQPFS
jgi:hypothetical protein